MAAAATSTQAQGKNIGSVEMLENSDSARKTDFQVLDANPDVEVVKIFEQAHGSDIWDPEEEKALVRKIDRRLLWILCIVYPLQAYDKTVLGQTAIFGIVQDLHLTGNQYVMCSAFLYIGYFCGSYPASLLGQLYPVERVAACLILTWGLCLTLSIVCTDFQGLVTERVFLGFLEGGLSPLCMLIIGSWYTKSEQALRIGIWWCSSGYAGFFAPLINYGIGQIKGGSLKSWQYMFLFAGAFTMLWSFIVWFLLPGDPLRARGFDARERYIAIARLRTNNSGVRDQHWRKEQVMEAFQDVRFWLMFFIAFFVMVGSGAYTTMTPIIINSLGFDSLHSLLISCPTGIVIGTVELVGAYVTYRTQNLRCIMMVVFQIPVFVGGLLLWLLPRSQTGPLLFALYVIPCFGGTYCLALALTLANCGGYTKRTVFAAAIFTGYCCGSLAGPLTFKANDAPGYAPAFIFLVVATIMCVILTLTYRYVCKRDNRKRDAAGITEGFDHAYDDDMTDKLGTNKAVLRSEPTISLYLLRRKVCSVFQERLTTTYH
ncbi:uncharacterized protein PV07_06204 [Cladophialophora immunda]|uniref:Major facilitator superfamily (MFS) profile domain-containing protein n=1 Tax=Cladophialophora immunda TaxID=569365 RepID=A0A0D2AYV7_9EURO|nr:uncharacterized protein PV07_06204 [Cladophialophora immunda]KIW30462.1 hypothetical protein PV07_06204 [Cladophialophora immunda]